MDNIGHEAYDLNWHDFPLELRKHIIVIIARSQEKISFDGLGLIGCSIEVFGNVSKHDFIGKKSYEFHWFLRTAFQIILFVLPCI